MKKIYQKRKSAKSKGVLYIIDSSSFNNMILLANKLKTIGLEVGNMKLEGDNGKVTAEVKQFGGRFGKDIDGSDINDDGISHRKEGGLKLQVQYETLSTGTSKVFAKLV